MKWERSLLATKDIFPESLIQSADAILCLFYAFRTLVSRNQRDDLQLSEDILQKGQLHFQCMFATMPCLG
ncbi:MAG: hypothetical protein U5N56_10125 [Candidatus Marinimicrobia bacterium]|nr:hypothetical protein [Candidatus Neomarinimicrobiota bacterium]